MVEFKAVLAPSQEGPFDSKVLCDCPTKVPLQFYHTPLAYDLRGCVGVRVRECVRRAGVRAFASAFACLLV